MCICVSRMVSHTLTHLLEYQQNRNQDNVHKFKHQQNVCTINHLIKKKHVRTVQTQSNIRKKIISTINHLKKNTSGSSSQTGNHSYSDAKPQNTHINTTRWLISLHLVNFLKIFLLLLRKPPFFFGFSSSAGLDVPGLEPSDLISEKLTFKGCLFELESVLGGCLSPILETCD